MPTVSAGQSTVIKLSGTEAIWVNSTGVGIAEFECGSPTRLNLTTEYQRIGYFGADSCIELRSVSGSINYQSTPPIAYPLTATAKGDKNNSSPVDVALLTNGLVTGATPIDAITLAGLPQTVGAPEGFGDLLSPIRIILNERAQQQQTVILFGDSYAEAFSFPTAPYNGDQLSISLYRFVFGGFGNSFKVTRNSGISGNTAAQMLSRYATDVTPYSSDWIFFNVGVNDFFGFGYTAEAVFGQVSDILDLMISEGRKVLMVNCPPQVTTRSGFTSAKSTQCALYNKLIADHVKTLQGVVLVDIYSQLVSWSDTTNAGAQTQFFGSDGIHLSVLGTIQCGNVIRAALSPHAAVNLSQPISPLAPGIGGTESVLVGTGGGNLAGSSGTVATGWASQRVSGTSGTIVASKITPVGQRQTITLIATNGDSRFRLSCDTDAEFAAHLGKTVTTTIRGRCRTTSGGVHLKELVLKLYLFDGTTITNATNGNAYSGYSPLADSSFDTGEFLVTLRDIQIPSPLSDSGVFIELLMNSVAGGVVEFDIYGVEIREVTP